MIILFIDDTQERHTIVERILSPVHVVLHAYNYADAIEILENSQRPIGLAMFDHDLGDFLIEDDDLVEYDGNKIASYVLRQLSPDKFPARAIVHSWNSGGAENIASKLRSAGIPTQIEPFDHSLIERLLIELEGQ
jgi:hypothetical protein